MDIVISGISGKFPKCENVEELKEKLLSGVELTTDKLPWKIDDEDFPKRIGKIRTFKEFDAGYFGILPKHANVACPMSRMLLEAAHEAIFDAGLNPESLRNTDTGVYIATCSSESSQAMNEDYDARTARRGLLISSPSILSGRISFWLGVRGPSVVVDTGCSTSLTVLDLAYRDIMSGHCTHALVGGANMIVLPHMTRLMVQDQYLSKQGRCFSFDDSAEGFVRSEAVAMVLLQRAEHANRVYCKIIGSRIGGEGFKEKGLTQTSGPGQVYFLNRCYQEFNINPLDVGYIEAHGPGTKAGDPEEAYALDTVFNNGRTEPLTIGSVKANLGHCEPVAGLVGLLKVIIAMETGTLPGSLNFRTPNTSIPSLIEGRIQIHNKSQEFRQKRAAVNSFGLGGSLAHVIVERYDKMKKIQNEKRLPWLVLCSGRTKEAIEFMCEKVTTGPIDPEVIGLVHKVHSSNIKNHLYRGYSVVGDEKNISGSAFYSGERRPICFAFTGMGSQWFKMGQELLQLPVFADSIEKCAKVLAEKKIDLYKVITTEEPGLFSFILNAFVGIISIQVALVDVLRDLGITPDFIVGQSLGELSCGYADGTLTLEQTILAAFYRGLVSVESVFIPGTMAAVGMTKDDLASSLIDGVEIACFNGPKSHVITGKKASVMKLCKTLGEQKVFVKEVPWACGIPYHSSYLVKSGAKFLDYLKEVIPEPRKRSEKWISSSVPETMWDTHLASYSSAEYHFNNFCKPVLFHDAFEKIPDNAIVIEIAPHGLMESVIKQFGKSNIDYISLSSKTSPNMLFFLSALGKIYSAGGLPQIEKLYPPISFPVSRGTKMLSPLVQWDHSQNWHIPVYDDLRNKGRFFKVIDPSDFKSAEFCVDGVPIYPISQCLVYVWQTVARMFGKKYENFPVMFNYTVFYDQILLDGVKRLAIDVKRETGYFEVTFDDKLHMWGNVTGFNVAEEKVSVSPVGVNPSCHRLPLKREDIYKELRLRGHTVGEKYKIANSIDFAAKTAELEWNGDWACALESINHFVMLQTDTRLLQIPTKFKKLILDPLAFNNDSKEKVLMNFDELSGIITCDIIQLIGLEISTRPQSTSFAQPLLERHSFFPHNTTGSSLYDAVHLCTHLLVENLRTSVVKILEYRPGAEKTDLLAPLIQIAFDNVPIYQCEISSFGVQQTDVLPISRLSEIPKNSRHLIALSSDELSNFVEISQYLHPDGFILINCKIDQDISIPYFTICVDHSWENGRLVMLKTTAKKNSTGKIIHLGEENEYKWLTKLQDYENVPDNLLLIASIPTSGVLGVIYTLQQEWKAGKVRCLFMIDQDVPKFSVHQSLYSDQLAKNLVVNVYKNGQWGSFRHVPFVPALKECIQVLYTPKGLLEGPLSSMTPKGQEPITVQFSTIRASNYRWIDFSGRTNNNTRVMGYHKQIGNSLMAPSKIVPVREACWKVPAKWAMNDAAASVLPYCKALMALQFSVGVSQESRVLIVGADSSVGFAMMSLALRKGCNVYGICENLSGMEKLQTLLPSAQPESMFLRNDLRNLRNKFRSFDVLVCPGQKILSEEMNTLRLDGTIVIFEADTIDFQDLPESVKVKKINTDGFLEDPKNRLFYAFQALLEANIPPIRSVITTSSEVEAASDKTGFERHVARWRGDEKMAKSQIWCNPCQSFVIIGGLGGFGLELIDWMISRGATKFIICSRSSLKTGYQSFRVGCWKTNGVDITITNEDITSENGVQAIIKQALAIGPIGGIFQLALALEMGILRNLTEENFRSMTETRYQAAKLFDQYSRKSCPELEHFVMFSSYVSGRGNMGQANYAYASSRMDRLMEIRKAEGFPALSIQWGPIGEVGALADAKDTGVNGTQFQHIASCIQTLDNLLNCTDPVVASCVLQPKTSIFYQAQTVTSRVSELMGIKDVSTVPPHATLAELGMDSILAVNIKSQLADDFHITLSLAEVRGLTFAKCATLSE